MTYDSFGLFSLIKSLLPLIAVISLAGFDKAYIKQYSNTEIKDVYYYLVCFISLISFLTSIVFSYFYELKTYFLIIFFASTFGAINLFLTSYFRLTSRYFLAQVIQSGHKVLFSLFIFIIFYFNYEIDNSVSILLGISFFFPSLFYFRYLSEISKKEKYKNILEFISIYKVGFTFFILNTLNLILLTMDKWIIPIIFGNEVLGIYSAIGFICITTFTMTSSAIGYVIFPELSKENTFDIKKFLYSSIFFCFLLSIIFFCFSDGINSYVYGNKYSSWHTENINIYFVVIGVSQFFNGIMHWYILSKGKSEIFFSYIKYMLIEILLVLIGSYFLVNNYYNTIDQIGFFMMIVCLVKIILNFFIINKVHSKGI